MCIHATHSKRMGTLHFSLALLLLLLLSSPVRAQWWSLIWPNLKTLTTSSPSIATQSVTSPGPTDSPGMTERLVTGDRVAEKALESNTPAGWFVLTPTPSPGVSMFGHSTVDPGTVPSERSAGGGSKARAQYKPLKHWKTGECYRDIRRRNLYGESLWLESH